MTDILFSILSFILGALAANLYQRAVEIDPWHSPAGDDTADALAEALRDFAEVAAENAALAAELDELWRRLDALGRVDLGG